MSSYIIRKLEDLPWPEIKARAALKQISVDTLIKRLLLDWLHLEREHTKIEAGRGADDV